MRKFIVMGPQGCGKGTQAKMLTKDFDLVHISVGDIFRWQVQHHTKLGARVKRIVASGLLVPDDLVNEVVVDRLELHDWNYGFILDGFPRTLAQAAALDDMLAQKKMRLDAVVELKVEDDVLVSRISGRFACAQCGAGYHDTNKPTTIAGVCDQCGAKEFVRRADDNAVTVQKRLMAYYRETAPLIGYYFAKGILKRVDGMAPIGEISQAIEAALGPREPV